MPWPNAQERAWIYRAQLDEIRGRLLRDRFLEAVRAADPAAYALLRRPLTRS